MSIIYTTYDTNFKQYMKECGIKYLICGQSVSEPHNTFWVYERNEKFNTALDEWLFNKKS